MNFVKDFCICVCLGYFVIFLSCNNLVRFCFQSYAGSVKPAVCPLFYFVCRVSLVLLLFLCVWLNSLMKQFGPVAFFVKSSEIANSVSLTDTWPFRWFMTSFHFRRLCFSSSLSFSSVLSRFSFKVVHTVSLFSF